MATFRALNVDSDHESEDEVDNTKEIQIEEALKLYQAALKFHSEGPSSFEKAGAAYSALFESDVFKYPESLSEFARHEVYGDTLVFDSILEDDYDAGPVQLARGNESAPHTLPQILHLAHKNRGKFLLETMQQWLQDHGPVPDETRSSHILKALQEFADALDKEDTDLDLWLRTASVAAMLGSHRITRFCLEAVLDGDDELVDSVLQLPGLEEGFASEQLKDLVTKLEDSLSLCQAPLNSTKRTKLSQRLKMRLNPVPFAPLPSEVSGLIQAASEPRAPVRNLLQPVKWDWAGVGEAILQRFHAEQGGLIDPPSGSSMGIAIPETIETPPSPRIVESAPTQTNSSDLAGVSRAQDNDEEVAPTINEADKATTPDGAEVDMEDAERDSTAKDEGETADDPPGAAAVAVPSRKRSTDSAGFPETADGGRSRSKRIRARDTVEGATGNEVAAPDPAKQLEDKLYNFTHADKCLFEIVNDSFERLGIRDLPSPQSLRDILNDPSPNLDSVEDIDRSAHDLYTALQSGVSSIAALLLSSENFDLAGVTREAGLNAFLGYAKTTTSSSCQKPPLSSELLDKFAQHINQDWLTLKEVALAWLEQLLSPGIFMSSTDGPKADSSYMQYIWAEDLKRHLVQVIVNFDDFIHEELLHRISTIDAAVLKARTATETYSLSSWDKAQFEMVEIIFELHLDVYSLIKHPHSQVDAITQSNQRDRLQRWMTLARDAMQLRSGCVPDLGLDQLALRHVWASVFHWSVSDDVSPQYVLHAMEELKDLIQHSQVAVLEVQNNAVMPELSVEAVDRELARLSMKDFFLKVFSQDEEDPVSIIESLEPILEPPEESPQTNKDLASNGQDDDTVEVQPADVRMAVQKDAGTPIQEMQKFLETAGSSLRLSLWQRLRMAYEAIEYTPKVVSCYLRSIEVLLGKTKSAPVQKESSTTERYMRLLRSVRIIDDIIVKILQIVRDDKGAFDCLSYEHLQASMSAIADYLRILSAANMLEDLLRVGHITTPRFESLPATTFVTITTRLHDMQLRAWMLQYFLLKDGIAQSQCEFPNPSEEQFEFLRHVHYATGIRGFSHAAGRQFLRLAKDEMLRMDDVIDGNTRDAELAQVLNDLYGLKTFTQAADCHVFGATPEPLDKKTAFQLLPFVLSQARKISVENLGKTDLKATIDKVHGALGRPKTNEDISANGRVLKAYFKSPVNPVDLFSCIKGVGTLSTKYVPPEAAVAASKGWYFLMGDMNLTKFQTSKRTGPGPTEDLNIAQAFFLQDLEYSVDRWETWYRLAQANDLHLEECVSWSADKINSNSSELLNYQRAAIHCYVQAVACAVRDADVAPQTVAKVADMYTHFGTRVYTSSREPFSMNAFAVSDKEYRFYSGSLNQLVYQNLPFRPLSKYTAWKFASTLFKRAIVGKPNKWWNYYMLGKCLWKMYCYDADEGITTQRADDVHTSSVPTWESVISTISDAIEALPSKRERGREPLLEPHYKLVSVVDKLFRRGLIDHQRGQEVLSQTSFSHNIDKPSAPEEWDAYILAILKALRAADKASWHHRMVARSAHIIYDGAQDPAAAYSAKHELTQQMFTKTMSVQVWKPEYERPGRHFVYTSRYTRFFIRLLDQTTDKANMEALARRVRRKQTDFFEHSKLWSELCQQYLLMLRRIGGITEGTEDAAFKSLNHEDFAILANRIEAWTRDPNTQNVALDVLRDVIDLKRLNNGLMKPAQIDDLFGDTYATLYIKVGPTLSPLPSEPSQQPQASQPGMSEAVALGNVALQRSQIDGSSEAAANSNLPFSIYHPSQLQPHPQLGPAPAATPTPAPETTSRPRLKAIGRREIQRRAEAAAVRPPAAAPTPAPSTTIPIRSPPAAQPSIVIPTPSRRTSTEGSPTKSPVKQTPLPTAPSSSEPLQVPIVAPTSGPTTTIPSLAASSMENSAPGSLNDDADDESESELSELDESEVREIEEQIDRDRALAGAGRMALFPGLRREEDGEEDEEDDDDEGEDEDEEEEEESAEQEGDADEGSGREEEQGQETREASAELGK